MAEVFKVTVIGPLTTNLTKTFGVTNIDAITCPVQLKDGEVMTCFWDKGERYPKITDRLLWSEIAVKWGDYRQDCVVTCPAFDPQA